MQTVAMKEYRDADRVRWLVGHGWCINQDTDCAIPGGSEALDSATYLARTHDIPSPEIEGCKMGLNARERKVYVRLRGEGKTVLRTGWPDLLVLDGEEVYAIEVKSPIDRVSDRQRETHEALRRAGLRVEVERLR